MTVVDRPKAIWGLKMGKFYKLKKKNFVWSTRSRGNADTWHYIVF